MGLKDDNINLQINIGVSGAAASIQKLNDENMKLASSTKEARTRMAELKAQGEKNSDEYKQLEATIKANTTAIDANKKKIVEHEKSLSLNEKTMVQLRKEAKNLQSQLDRTVASADPKGYADLQKQLESVKGRMGELRSSGQSLTTQLQGIPGPAGAVTKGVMGIHKAFLTLLANPIIAVIAAVAAIFMALYKAISTSEEATNKLNAIMAPLRATMDAILNVVQKVVIGLLDFIATIIEFVRTVSEKLPVVGKYFKEINDYEREAIKLEKSKQVLAKKERETLVENAEAEMKVSKLRTEAKRKDLFTSDQRLAKIEEAIKLEQEMADREYANAKERLRIAEAEAARAGNTAETEQKLAEMRAATFQAEKQYYDRSRELTEQMNSARNESANEEKKRVVDLLQKKMEAVDRAIAAEKASLIQSRLNKEIDEKTFNKKMEELELEALNRKLEIHGLEKKKRDEINAAILAAKLKMLQEEEKKSKELTEKLRVDALSKSEKEIDDIRKKYEEREKLLVESKEQGLITEAEYAQRLQVQREEMQAEIDKKTTEQRSSKATEELREMEQAYDRERILIMEQYANREISQAEYQQRLLDLEREFLAERLMINGWTEEQIAKLKEKSLQKQIADREKEEEDAEKKEKERLQKRAQIFLNFGEKIGTILGEFLTGTENSIADALGEMLLLTLDSLRQMVTLAIAETTIRNIKTLGLVGAAKAAAEIALINAAFAAVKGVIKKPSSKNANQDTNDKSSDTGRLVVNQRAFGKYDVIGQEDGNLYRNVEYVGDPETGLLKKPTLVAEKGEELIVSSPDLQLLKKHGNYPYVVSAINDVRAGIVRQRASGNYSVLPSSEVPSDSGMQEVLSKLQEVLARLEENGLKSYIGMDEWDAQRKLRDDARAIGTIKRS
jgi:hypothetical protein